MTKDNEDALQCAEKLESWYGPASAEARHLRRLVAENEALNHYRKVYGEVSAILACTAEMPPPSDDDEITVQRLKALVHDFEVYVDSCAAKADRIDRLGEAVVKLRSENEAKDALLRQTDLHLSEVISFLRGCRGADRQIIAAESLQSAIRARGEPDQTTDILIDPGQIDRCVVWRHAKPDDTEGGAP